MKTKYKINLIIIAALSLVVAMIYLFNLTNDWRKYHDPLVEKNVILGIYEANDYPLEGNTRYYYQVKGDVRYSRDTWPDVKMEVLKSDTLLLLHNCASD